VVCMYQPTDYSVWGTFQNLMWGRLCLMALYNCITNDPSTIDKISIGLVVRIPACQAEFTTKFNTIVRRWPGFDSLIERYFFGLSTISSTPPLLFLGHARRTIFFLYVLMGGVLANPDVN
jgi:hypothetical protein